jgi:gamma-glutamyltranspeptidase/glutathione hydrolase
VLDRAGNRVAATLSINFAFGSAFIAPGTGVLLNDEMDDFAAAPGQPNVYGLVGAQANRIEPGKRPLSSMTPTFLDSDARTLIVGTPGGGRIISMLLLASLGLMEGEPLDAVLAAPRFHHQYLPDTVQYEPGAFSDALKDDLELRGHVLTELEEPYGNMQIVAWDRRARRVQAASDPRGIGTGLVR